MIAPLQFVALALIALADAAGRRPGREVVRLRVGVFNAVESGKRGLLRDRAARAARVLRWAASEGAAILLVQESGTYLQRAVRRLGALGYRAFYAPPNTRAPAGNRGNGILWRWRLFKRLDAVVLEIPFGGRTLHLPVVLLRHRATGLLVAAASVHAPTRRDDPSSSTRELINDAIVAYIASIGYADDAVRVVVAGDSNDGTWLADIAKAAKNLELETKLKRAASRGVDWILVGRGVHRHGAAQVHHLPRLSDHHALTVDLAFTVPPDEPAKAGARRPRLPRPGRLIRALIRRRRNRRNR